MVKSMTDDWPKRVKYFFSIHDIVQVFDGKLDIFTLAVICLVVFSVTHESSNNDQ